MITFTHNSTRYLVADVPHTEFKVVKKAFRQWLIDLKTNSRFESLPKGHWIPLGTIPRNVEWFRFMWDKASEWASSFGWSEDSSLMPALFLKSVFEANGVYFDNPYDKVIMPFDILGPNMINWTKAETQRIKGDAFVMKQVL